ncbi:MAG: hypothetical protein KGI28_05535 [Thaumarchaeota archaeon]|nr:hypothetical protein [Nitrososphaerota archaeon]
MKAVLFGLFIIPILILTSILGNTHAVCSTGASGSSLCAGPDFSATLDKTNYQSNDFPLITISGPADKVLSVKVLDSASLQMLSDTVIMGENGKMTYSFGLSKFSFSKYQVQVSDGISIIKLNFSVGESSKQLPKSASPRTDQAYLMIYTNVSWQATIQTSSDNISINGNTDTKYSFTCADDDTYNITIQSPSRKGNGIQLWTVANLMQDGKMLDVGENHVANGQLTLSGKCHVSQFPLSNNGLIYFTTDRTSYRPGDMIQVSGYILPYMQRQQYVLTCTVQNSQGMAVQTDSTGFMTLNTFGFNIVTRGGLWKPDTYKITLELAKSTAETKVMLTSIAQKQFGTSQSTNIIPASFKIIAKDWVAGKTSDDKFIQTVQGMIKQGILKIPYYNAPATSTQTLLSWIKSSTNLWLNGKMSDDDFANVLKHLNLG